MPPSLHVRFPRLRPSLAIRAGPPRSVKATAAAPWALQPPRRHLADDRGPAQGPNQDVLPHVSEEAAQTSEITGEPGPDLDQGTPVQDVLKRDPAGREKAPEVIKESVEATIADLKKAAARFEAEENASAAAAAAAATAAEVAAVKDRSLEGLKFGKPDLSLATKLRNRYDSVVQQVTRLMMRDGKLATAQKHMSLLLNQLRLAPPPGIDPQRPLIPGSPPAQQLPLDPIRYLGVAIDSVAPLFRIRSIPGAAGGGNALQVPQPLNLRQRRRAATMWILEAASKRPSHGSGGGPFAHRIADEIRAVVEGRSLIWEKRTALHKLGVSLRANVATGPRRRW